MHGNKNLYVAMTLGFHMGHSMSNQHKKGLPLRIFFKFGEEYSWNNSATPNINEVLSDLGYLVQYLSVGLEFSSVPVTTVTFYTFYHTDFVL